MQFTTLCVLCIDLRLEGKEYDEGEAGMICVSMEGEDGVCMIRGLARKCG